MLREQIRPAIMIFVALTVVTGVIYPLIVTGTAQAFFSKEANGSMIRLDDGRVAGSVLIGQNFNDPKYFWGRLSATTPAYNAAASSGSNLGPLNPALADATKARIEALRATNSGDQTPVPIDLVTASSSGLDPHLSLAGAYYQISRVARSRGLSAENVKQIVDQKTSGRFLGLLGEPVVNILKVNLALDRLKK